MLRSLKELGTYHVNAIDGGVGNIERFLFDDSRWAIRYLVVKTGGPVFLNGHIVLISPRSFLKADASSKCFHLSLTCAKVASSPSVDLAKPVSRQHEMVLNRYYNYPYYWGYPGLWGMGAYPASFATKDANNQEQHDSDSDDVHLRSDEEVRGYHVVGTDEAIGHIEDFIVDDQTWAVRYLVVDTSNWWFGKKVLVAPQWASNIGWAEQTVNIDLSRQTIKDSPEWDATAAMDRDYESSLYAHYQRPVYWDKHERIVPMSPIGEPNPGEPNPEL